MLQKMQFEGHSSVTVKSEDGGPPLVLAVHEPPAGVRDFMNHSLCVVSDTSLHQLCSKPGF